MFSTLRFLLRYLVLTVSLVSGAMAAGAQPAPPNILIIVADDLGFADVGFNGGKVIATPNLDRLAETGVNLADFRACPMCSPTRAGLMTGRWPARFGMMRAVVPPWSPYGLPAAERTLPELLSEAGYAQRAIMGKWHLGHAQREFLPLAHGFTHFYGHYNGAITYFSHERDGEVDWHHDDRTVRESGYATDLLAAAAERFVRTAPPARPWFLYVPFNAPHSPFEAKRPI
jgi:arylsulfatase B